VQAAVPAEGEFGRAGHDMAGDGPLALLRVDAADHRQAPAAEDFHRIGLEADVRVDPHGFLKPLGHGIGGQLVAALVDGRESNDAADDVTAALEGLEPVLAHLHDVAGVGD